MKRLIESQWETFQELVVPPDASPIQQQEMKRAFYAGCAAFRAIMTTIGEVDEKDSRAADVLTALVIQEMKDYTEEVGVTE